MIIISIITIILTTIIAMSLLSWLSRRFLICDEAEPMMSPPKHDSAFAPISGRFAAMSGRSNSIDSEESTKISTHPRSNSFDSKKEKEKDKDKDKDKEISPQSRANAQVEGVKEYNSSKSSSPRDYLSSPRYFCIL